jgi:Dyp-type peroxidase family
MSNPVIEPPREARRVVPLGEVQGIILRGYELLKAARFVLLKVGDPAAARRWLGELSKVLTSAETRPAESAINVAFTYQGLERLGLPPECLAGFSREFQEGMDADHRRRILGDTEPHTPDGWDWGNRADADNVHVLLMVYADTPERLESMFGEQEKLYRGAGLVEHPRGRFDPLHLEGRKEHFGFRDGIAQPAVAGVIKEPPVGEREDPGPDNAIPAGEFLLGYENAYGEVPPSPVAPAAGGRGPFDIGEHGSYLVVRQLAQDVRKFWSTIREKTRRPGQTEAEHRLALQVLAAKMVGRWPSGAPLALSPAEDRPELLDEDKYAFAEKDPLGLITPLGSHTRRSNPRDSLEPGPGGEGRLTAEDSAAVTRLHRIIRRGRPYGPPVAPSMQIADILARLDSPDFDESVERGLLFLCFNANIARQFEFIQQTWINNPKFGGLYEDPDPLMGHRQASEMDRPTDVFTVQSEPVRRRYKGLPDFVTTRGGGYFFTPGLAAVRYLAGLQPQ